MDSSERETMLAHVSRIYRTAGGRFHGNGRKYWSECGRLCRGLGMLARVYGLTMQNILMIKYSIDRRIT